MITLLIVSCFVPEQGSVHKHLLIGCVCLFPILIYIKFYSGGPGVALAHLGLACAVSSVINYGSPLAGFVSTFFWMLSNRDA